MKKEHSVLFVFTMASIMLSSSCAHERLHVRQVAQPDYPSAARYANLQGTVEVKVWIGTDGRVIFVKGTGAAPILVTDAEKNAREWLFGPFPDEAQFPIEHTITYIYKLQGKPIVVAIPATVKTALPDKIEITATRLESDYPVVEKDKAEPIK